MRHFPLTWMILQLNQCLDGGKYDDITIKEVYKHMADGTIFDLLRSRLSQEDYDDDLFNREPGFKTQFVNYLKRMHNAYSGDHGRKWGVQKKGLCLLLAWTNELLKLGSDWKPPEGMLDPI